MLDALLGVAIQIDALDISSFRKILKVHNRIQIPSDAGQAKEEIDQYENALIRDCSYYQEALGGKT